VPASGRFGTHQRNRIKGPGFQKVDLALSRLVSLAATRTIELRLEVLTGDPRIMQFGIK
jgi:hypothetical protein